MISVRKWISKTGVLVPFAAIWVAAIGVGATVALKYADTPGRLATPPVDWPGGVAVRPSAKPYTLLLFLHPECACSSATIEELSRLLALGGKVETLAFILAPHDSPEWRASHLYEDAGRIPGVRVLSDPDGAIGQRFGAHTSGQVLLYDSGGRLLFSGGITATRGHVGPNDGFDALYAIIHGARPTTRTTPVFGCSL